MALDEVHMFSPTFILNFRYGLTQQISLNTASARVSTSARFGSRRRLVSLFPTESAVPNVQLGSVTQLSGSESGDGAASSLVHSFVGNFTNVRGKHSFKFGPEFRLYRVFSDRHSSQTTADHCTPATCVHKRPT